MLACCPPAGVACRGDDSTRRLAGWNTSTLAAPATAAAVDRGVSS
ncbi:hypothetical protein ACN265_17275 [Micromonospora sp. WMMD730]